MNDPPPGADFFGSLKDLFEEARENGIDSKQRVEWNMFRLSVVQYLMAFGGKMTVAKARASNQIKFPSGEEPRTAIARPPSLFKLDIATRDKLLKKSSGNEFVGTLRAVYDRQTNPQPRKRRQTKAKRPAETEQVDDSANSPLHEAAPKPKRLKLTIKRERPEPQGEQAEHDKEELGPQGVGSEPHNDAVDSTSTIDTASKANEVVTASATDEADAGSQANIFVEEDQVGRTEDLDHSEPVSSDDSGDESEPASKVDDDKLIVLSADAEAFLAELCSRIEITAPGSTDFVRPQLLKRLRYSIGKHESPPDKNTISKILKPLEGFKKVVESLDKEVSKLTPQEWAACEKTIIKFCLSQEISLGLLDEGQRLRRIVRLAYLPDELRWMNEGNWDAINATAMICATVATVTGPKDEVTNPEVSPENASNEANQWAVSKFRDCIWIRSMLEKARSIFGMGAPAAESSS